MVAAFCGGIVHFNVIAIWLIGLACPASTAIPNRPGMFNTHNTQLDKILIYAHVKS